MFAPQTGSSVKEYTLKGLGSQKVKKNPPNAHKLMEQQNVVYPYNWLLYYSITKKWITDTCYNIENIMLCDINQTQRKNIVWFHLC